VIHVLRKASATNAAAVLFAQVASSIAREEEAMKTRDSRLVLLLSALGLAAGNGNHTDYFQ
jgi:hypothetical protein